MNRSCKRCAVTVERFTLFSLSPGDICKRASSLTRIVVNGETDGIVLSKPVAHTTSIVQHPVACVSRISLLDFFSATYANI